MIILIIFAFFVLLGFSIQLSLMDNLRGRLAELVCRQISNGSHFVNFPAIWQFIGSEVVYWTVIISALFFLIFWVTGSVVSSKYLCMFWFQFSSLLKHLFQTDAQIKSVPQSSSVWTLVTQPMLQRRPNRSELRSMDSYTKILCRFQKCKRKVPPPSLLSTKEVSSLRMNL